MRTQHKEIEDSFTATIYNNYQELAERTAVIDFYFMNYGYAELEDHQHSAPLDQTDERWCYSLQLYYNLVKNIDPRGLDILEVGSGRGGGADVIKRYFNPKTIVGLDISDKAIDLSNKAFAREGLSFKVGNAHNLPVGDKKYDIVINVESSHCYSRIDDFFAETERVLKPNGLFLYTDFRKNTDVIGIINKLYKAKLSLLKYEDISKNVVSSLSSDNSRKDDLLDLISVNEQEKEILSYIYAMKGTPIYLDFSSGELIYYAMVLQK